MIGAILLSICLGVVALILWLAKLAHGASRGSRGGRSGASHRSRTGADVVPFFPIVVGDSSTCGDQNAGKGHCGQVDGGTDTGSAGADAGGGDAGGGSGDGGGGGGD